MRIRLVSAPEAAVPAQTACVNLEGSRAASPYTAGCASPSTTPTSTAMVSKAAAVIVPPAPLAAAMASHAGTAATSTAKAASPPTALARGNVFSCESSRSTNMRSSVTGR